MFGLLDRHDSFVSDEIGNPDGQLTVILRPVYNTYCNMGYFAQQEDMCMHLTNYAINKHSKDFDRDEESGSKRYYVTLWDKDQC